MEHLATWNIFRIGHAVRQRKKPEIERDIPRSYGNVRIPNSRGNGGDIRGVPVFSVFMWDCDGGGRSMYAVQADDIQRFSHPESKDETPAGRGKETGEERS
jgi:hypothetical protein